MLQPSDFTPRVLNAICTILNQGYECEIKYASNNLCVLKIKRKCLYKVANEDDIKNHLLPNITKQLDQEVKVEFKREHEKIAIVLVKKQEVNRSKGTL